MRLTVVPMLAVMLAACAGAVEGQGTTSTEALEISTTAATTPAMATTSTSFPSTSTSSFPPGEFDCPPALIVADRVTWIDERCSVSEVSANEVVRAMDDHSGGLLYQSDDEAIWHQAVGSAEPVPLAEAGPDETIWLEDVGDGSGSPRVWFSRFAGTTPEDSTQNLESITLGDPGTSVIGQVGGWERLASVSVGGDLFAIQAWAEGYYGFNVAGPDLEPIDQAWNPFPDTDGDFVVCLDMCPFGLVISDGGDRVAFVEPSDQGPIVIPVLVVIDLSTGATIHRLEVSGLGWPSGPAEGPSISGLDLLGDVVVINGQDDGQSFPAIWTDLSDPAPVWEQFAVRGDARLLRSNLLVGPAKG